MRSVKDIGRRLAFAGLGTAIALIFITLGFFIKNLSLSFTVLAGCGVMLPLAAGYYREGLLTSVAAGGLGFLIANINVLSFVLASSFYIVFTVFWREKNFNKWLGYLIKAAYSILVFYLLYKVLNLLFIDFSVLPSLNNLPDYAIYIIFNAVFTVAFIAYDILIVQLYLYVKKLLAKYNKSNG